MEGELPMSILASIRSNKSLQLFIGLLIGTGFGFLLQKGGLTSYNVIIGQLLFTDFAVLKTMMTAVITGMIGGHLLKSAGVINFHPKQGSLGATIIGGLIFGVGFALLGYCPGTVVGAAAQGSFDALFGGIAGITLGAGLFAALYPRLENGILKKGFFGELTLPQLLKTGEWTIIIPLCIMILSLFIFLEKSGF
jgi:uncharacterized protein